MEGVKAFRVIAWFVRYACACTWKYVDKKYKGTGLVAWWSDSFIIPRAVRNSER